MPNKKVKLNKEERKKLKNLAKAKRNNNDKVKTVTRKQLLSTGGISFQGFIVFAKEIKQADKFRGFTIIILVTKFLNESINEQSISIVVEEKVSADKDEVEQWKKKLSAEGKVPPAGKNIKYITNGNTHDRTIKIGDLVEVNMWNLNKDDFPILPTEVKDFDLLNFVNFTIDIRNEKGNISEYKNLSDFSLVGSGSKEFFNYVNNVDLKMEIINIRKYIENDLKKVNDILKSGDKPTFYDLQSIIGNNINKLYFFSTAKKYPDGTLDNFFSDEIINSKRRVQIGTPKHNPDNTNFSIPVTIIYDQFNVEGLQHTVQFEFWKAPLLDIGINGRLFEKNYDKIINNLDFIIEGKISKDSLTANKHLIDKEESGNCIILFVQKLIPIHPSLFNSIGLQINFEIVKFIIKHYFNTINFMTTKPNKRKNITKILEFADINELNKKKNGVYSLLECDQNLNRFRNNNFYFFIIDDNNHTKANNLLNDKFPSDYGDNDKKFNEILKHLKDGKSDFSASIQFDIIGNERDKDSLDFSIFAIEKEIYKSWIDIDNMNKKGSEDLKAVLDDTYEKLDEKSSSESDDEDHGNSNDEDIDIDNEMDIVKKKEKEKTSIISKKTKPKPPSKKSTTNKSTTTSKLITPKKSTQSIVIEPKINPKKRSVDSDTKTSDSKKSRRK